MTRCIDTGVLSTADLVVAHHDRGVARFLEWWNLPDIMADSAYQLLEEALDDADTAIELEPDFAAVYCLRGNIIYNLSWGESGYDDIDKGRQLGKSSEAVYLLE